MELSITYVEPYFKQNNPKRREHHEDYLEAYEQHAWHFEGEYPEPLIDERRPAEHEDIKAWRKKVYQPMTKAPCSKVFTSLQKIQKSPDWHITPTKDTFSRIAEGEDLYTYLFSKYPTFKTVEKYATDVYLRQYLMDAGAICVNLPINIAKLDNEYFQPMAQIINSEYVMEFVPNELFIWDGDEKITYTYNNQKREGFVYYAITNTHLYRYEQIDPSGKFREAFIYVHNLGVLPAFEIGSVVVEFQKSERKYETRVCGMLPSLNEAVREYSDSQAEMVQHVFSTMYTYESPDCNICRGTGEIPSAEGAIKCTSCNGKGKFPFNPFEHIVISKDALTDQAPNPPAAYIQKQTEIISIMDARFKQRIYDALSAVNMEFLAEKPIAQSGVAKQYDAEELNNFVYSVAEDMIYFITMTAYLSAKWRYSGLYPNDADIVRMLPQINVPIKYEIVSDSVMLEDITRMTTAKVDSTLVQAAQIEYARRKFSTNPMVAEQVIARMELDPLAGMSSDDILSGQSLGVISLADIDIHYNINKYISRAIAEVKNWNDLTRQEKYAKLLTYTNANAGSNN